MDKNKEIEDLLRKLCRWAKNNCNGGRVFTEDVNKMVPLVREKIVRILENDKSKASIPAENKTKKNRS